MPASSIQSFAVAGLMPRLTPNFANVSAVPVRLLAARLPCLATLMPAPAQTRAVAVEIDNVCRPVPPVPTISITSKLRSTGIIFCRITSVPTRNSCAVRPIISRPSKRALICSDCASPFKMVVKADRKASGVGRSPRPSVSKMVFSKLTLCLQFLKTGRSKHGHFLKQ